MLLTQSGRILRDKYSTPIAGQSCCFFFFGGGGGGVDTLIGVICRSLIGGGGRYTCKIQNKKGVSF